MDMLTLRNGVQMPMIGYGTYQTPPSQTERCVSAALRVGYRAVDTAQCYGNEREVGAACRKSGIPRADLFLTTKIWACQGYRDSLRSIDASLKRLGTDYVDLLLIHEPTGDVHAIYGALEKALADGKARAIGISNFLEDRYLDLVKHCDEIPAINQMETHVFRQQKGLRPLEERYGTCHESWSPLACGRNRIWSNPVLREIAGNHQRSVSQVALRFLTQQGIPVIPKSTQESHMRENLASLDFTLTPEELRRLEGLDAGRSLFGWW